MSISSISDGRALQHFIELAKSTHSTSSLISLVQEVLSSPNIYVFGELLHDPSFQTTMNFSPEGKLYLQLLQTFAYGTFQDYKNNRHLPELSPAQTLKLKHLTFVSLASKSRSISYDELMDVLDISHVRDLEDLIIECIYLGLCTGRLNPAQRLFEVDETFGRDVKMSDLSSMREVLVSWCKGSQHLLDIINQRISWASSQYRKSALIKERREFRINQTLSNMLSSNEKREFTPFKKT